VGGRDDAGLGIEREVMEETIEPLPRGEHLLLMMPRGSSRSIGCCARVELDEAAESDGVAALRGRGEGGASRGDGFLLEDGRAGRGRTRSD
jgi:hypothetical protein